MANNNSTIISFNKEQAGIEVRFPQGRRLTESEKKELSELHLSWHRKNHYYYTRYSDEKMADIKKSFVAKDATLPSAKDTKEIQKLAAEKAAQAPAKKPSNRVKTSDALAEMQAQIAQLTALLASQQAPTK